MPLNSVKRREYCKPLNSIKRRENLGHLNSVFKREEVFDYVSTNQRIRRGTGKCTAKTRELPGECVKTRLLIIRFSLRSGQGSKVPEIPPRH